MTLINWKNGHNIMNEYEIWMMHIWQMDELKNKLTLSWIMTIKNNGEHEMTVWIMTLNDTL